MKGNEAPHLISLTPDQKISWLQLLRTPNIGPVTFWKLINYCGGADQALKAVPTLFQRSGRRDLLPISRTHAIREFETAQRMGARLVARGERGYPTLLAHLETPPPLLYIKGRTDLAEMPMIAIVGSRNGSIIGQKFTRKIATELGNKGYAIVSGLARGIDTAAHQASLPTGSVAVIAGGIDNIYPPQNRELQSKLEHDGLVISESPPGHEPRAQDFPRRNRIISGCCLGTLVVEAGMRSGSLITARLAGEQGRDVMAVPGHPLDPRAAGTNRLIRNGATLITSSDDVIETVKPIESSRPTQPSSLFEHPSEELIQLEAPIETSARDHLLQVLSPSPLSIDEIIRGTGLSAREVNILLMELCLAGRVHYDSASMVRRLLEPNPNDSDR